MGSNTTTTQSGGPTSSNMVGTSFNQTTRDPYGATLPYLDSLSSQAQALRGTSTAQMEAMGNFSSTPYNESIAQIQNDPTGYGNPDMARSLAQLRAVSSGEMNIGTGNLYQQLFNQAQQPGTAQANLSGLAANPTGALTGTQQAILDQNADRIGNRQASLYSGAGRYGSFGAGIGMARGIAETNNPLIAQFNQAGIQNSLNANQQISQDVLGRMGMAGTAAGGLSNVQQQNIGNRMNAANSELQAMEQAKRRQQQWAQMSPALFNMAMAPSQAPWQDLQNQSAVAGAIAPYLANAGTIRSNANTSQNSSGFSSNTGTTSTPTPWTTYAGLGLAGIGALAPFAGVSDRRMKTDITKLGKDPHTSLNMYAFRYKGDPKTYPKMVGPMAQEVKEQYPEAVGSIGGILYIKAA